MRGFKSAFVACLIVLGTAGVLAAQQSGQPSAAPPGRPAPAGASAPTDAASPMSPQMMQMCRQMMGATGETGMIRHGMGGPGMMPGMMPMTGDPKRDAEMLEMHGEMMKAMGDIMMKHAQRMRSTQ